MQVTISQADLTSEDSKVLWQRLIAVGVFLVIAVTMVLVFSSTADFGSFETGTYIFLTFGFFFFGIIFYMILGIVRDLFKGEKQIIRGVVTDKRTHKSSSSRGGHRGGTRGRSRGRSSSSKPKHYLYFGDKKFYVEHKHYNEVLVGKPIELHYAPHANASLRVVQLSDTGRPLMAEKPKSFRERLRERAEQIAAIPMKEVGMTQADRKLLKKARNKALRLNLSFAIIGSFMLLAFTLGAVLWWVMIFPAVFLLLWVIYFTRKSFKTLRFYHLDAGSGIKVIYKTKILDKQSQSGSGYGFSVRTEVGTFNVPKSIYEVLQGQEDAMVSIGKHSGWLVDIQTKSLQNS